MVTYTDGKARYSGVEPIIFGNSPLPDHKKAIEKLNFADMRGVIVEAKVGFLGVGVGVRGIVYETYKDFDKPEAYGWSIIFENGDYDGFSLRERKEMGMIKVIGVHPPSQDYEFRNVTELSKDWKENIFKFR